MQVLTACFALYWQFTILGLALRAEVTVSAETTLCTVIKMAETIIITIIMIIMMMMTKIII